MSYGPGEEGGRSASAWGEHHEGWAPPVTSGAGPSLRGGQGPPIQQLPWPPMLSTHQAPGQPDAAETSPSLGPSASMDEPFSTFRIGTKHVLLL